MRYAIPTRRHWLALALLLLLGGILADPPLKEPPSKQHRPVQYVAYIGRTDSKDSVQKNDSLAMLILEEYLDSLNKETRDSFKLQAYFLNVADTLASRRFYEDSIDSHDHDYALVVDGTRFATIRNAAAVIRRDSIPVIVTNADRGPEDFGPSALFIGQDDAVPQMIATFAGNVLPFRSAIFVAESTYWLSNEFRPALEQAGIKPSTLLLRDSAATNFATLHDRLNELIGRRQPHPQLVILNTHRELGRHVIEYIDQKFDSITILAGSFVAAGPKLPLSKFRGNRLILVKTDPVDARLEKVELDVARYQQSSDSSLFHQENVEPYVKRCIDVVSIIRSVLLTDTIRASQSPLPRDASYWRSKFHAFFQDSVRNRTLRNDPHWDFDVYSFDSLSRLIRDWYFEVHARGSVETHQRTVNAAGAVIPVVRFGLDVTHMGEINPESNTFHAQFYYWLASTGIGDRKFTQFRNLTERDLQDTVIPASRGDSLRYELYRISGAFHVIYHLEKYPRDAQDLIITLESAIPSESVRVSFDYDRFKNDTMALRNRLRIPGWTIQHAYVAVDNGSSPGLYGEPDMGGSKTRFKTLNLHLLIKRQIQEPLLVVVVPLLLIGFAATCTLFVRNPSFARLGEASVGIFLSIVAYSIAYTNVVPKSDQVIRTDWLVLATFAVVLINLSTVIVISSDLNERWPALKRFHSTWYAALWTVLYAILVGLIMCTEAIT